MENGIGKMDDGGFTLHLQLSISNLTCITYLFKR